MNLELKAGVELPGTRLHLDTVENGPPLPRIASSGACYRGLKAKLMVAEGDHVHAGDTLYVHRAMPELRFVAPGTGRVTVIRRGARRSLESVEIELDDPDEPPPRLAAREAPLQGADPARIRQALTKAGLWCAFRTRPFNRVPRPDASPRTLFVTALDTSPFAPDPGAVIEPRADEFRAGLECLARLSPQRLIVCTAPDAPWSLPRLAALEHVRVNGPHPAGLPGTHIHWLDPGVSLAADTWHVGYQDVLAIGALYGDGSLDMARIVAVGGPGVERPRLFRTRVGAAVAPLISALPHTGSRVLSGCLFGGRRISATDDYLGPYHNQITVLPEGECESAWSVAGLLRALRPRSASRTLSTALHGRPGAMVPVEGFDAVWPLDVPPALLLRALLNGDTETAAALGCLALDAEDLALCSWICPGKLNYGAALLDTLEELERSG